MRVITGRVVGGKIETDLEEGTPVAILAPGESSFHLSLDEEEELVVALSNINEGEFEDGQELLRQLKATSRR